jgi:RHS repeat-associated protein
VAGQRLHTRLPIALLAGAPLRRLSRARPRRRLLAAALSSVVVATGVVPPSAVVATPKSPEAVESGGQTAPSEPVKLQPGDTLPAAPIEIPAAGGGSAIIRDPSIGGAPKFSSVAAPSATTEIPDLRTERTRTYANPDGTYTLQETISRLNYRDPSGAWQPLDLNLIREASGAFDLRVTANDVQVAFGADSADEALARLATDTDAVAVRALDFPSTLTDAPADVAPSLSPAPSTSPEPSPTLAPSPSPSAPAASESAPVPTPTPAPSPAPSPSPSAVPSELPSPTSSPALPASPTPPAEPIQGAVSRPGGDAADVPALPSPELLPSPTPAPTPPKPAELGPESLVFTKDATAGRIFTQPTDTGFQFGAIIDGPTQFGRYSFAVDVGDLEASLDLDGRTILLNRITRGEGTSDSQLAAAISAPYVLDANEAPAPPATVTVELYRPGVDLVPPLGVSPEALAALAPNEIIVTYTIDPLYLAAPDRAYPLVLDPNACIGQGASGCTINDTSGNFDHFIGSGIADTYPLGWTTFRVGYDVRGDDGDTYGTMRGLLYFSPVTLPDGAVVHDADLRVHISSEYGGPAGDDVWAYRVTKSWGQTTTWNQFNSAYTTTAGISDVIPASGTMDFDVDDIARSFYTRRAQDWKAGYGFLLKMSPEGSAYGEVEFDRYNDATASNRPLFEIDYTLPKVGIDFDGRLGPNYAPSKMVAGQAAKLPIIVRNKTGSGHVLDKCTADGDCWQVGYRWFDAKSNLVAGGDTSSLVNLPADVAIGASSSPFAMTVSPPATVGQYTLRLDLVHYTGGRAWASDWATPSKFYSRNKKVLTSDNTRWTGSSAIERDEFGIDVVAGAGAGHEESVATGSGGRLGIDLHSRNLDYQDDTGLGFDDRVPLDLSYGYNAADATRCAGYQGILDACGWYLNYDERISGGPNQTGYDYTYQGPDGERAMIDTDADGQLVGGAPVLLNRSRYTYIDENDAPVPGADRVDAATADFSMFAGSYGVRATSNASQSVSSGGDKVDLNTYSTARFAMRTTAATNAALCFKIHNVDDSASHPDRWFCYTVGPNWTTGLSQVALGGTVLNNWVYYSAGLYNTIHNDTNFGGTFDNYQVIDAQIRSSSGSNSGYTYLDGFRLESGEQTILNDANVSWTVGAGLTSVWTPPSGDTTPAGGFAIKVNAAAMSSSPSCRTSNNCWLPTSGGLWSYAFAHWHWRKAGGQSAAVTFWFHDERSGAPCNASDCVLTYYAGPTPPPGATNPIQVSPHTPTEWTLVRRNILEDARTVLNLFDDAGTAGPDDVMLKGYGVAAIDGAYLLIDAFAYGSLADTGAVDPTGTPAGTGHPSTVGDATFTYDFSADYPDGSRHYFNRDGLLVRITDRDANAIALDWTIPILNVQGPAAYRLDAIHASTDGTTNGGTTFDRQFALSRGSDGSLGTIRFDEVAGTTTADESSRAAIFETTNPAKSQTGLSATATYNVNGGLAWLGNSFWPKDGTPVTISGTISGNADRSVGIECPDATSNINIRPANAPGPWTLTVPAGGVTASCRAYIWTAAGTATLTSATVSYAPAIDLMKVSPARHVVAAGASGAFCGTHPNGCVEFEYTNTVNHRLQYVADPRWDGSTGGSAEYRWRIDWDGSNNPIAVRDMSHGSGGTALLNVVTFSDTRDASLLYTRPLWQDAASAAADSVRAADISSDGRVLTEYAPRNCGSGCVTLPLTTNQANYRTGVYEFDGLARVNTVKTLRCPAASDAIIGCTGTTELVSVTRQGTNAGAKVDNYNDPLAGAEVPWSQSADQYFSSMRDSAGTNPDLYRDETQYGNRHDRTTTSAPRWNRYATYGATVTGSDYVRAKGYWRLDETAGASAADSSGNAKTGTFYNAPALGGSGALQNAPANKAPALDGTNDYMSVPAATMGTISSSFTVEAWFKVSDTTTTHAIVGTRGPSDYGFDVKLMAGTTIHGDIGSGSAWLSTTADAKFSYQANRWYHLAFAVGGGVYAIYVDGTLVGSGTYSGTALLTNGTHALYVGQMGGGTEYFAGGIDEVAVYDVALPASYVRNHTLAGRSIAGVRSQTLYDAEGHPTQVDAGTLENGGYEDGTNGWFTRSGATGYVATGPTDPSVHGGSGSLQVTGSGEANQELPFVPGQTVRVQIWVKAESGANCTWIGQTWDRATSAWVTLFAYLTTSTSWTSYANDWTIPLASDGRLRFILYNGAQTGTGRFDDAFIGPAWAATTYRADGLATDIDTLRFAGSAATLRAHTDYTPGATYPGIFPTASISNYVDGTQGPAADEDVRSQATFDAWGRTASTTDPDGVAATTHYAVNQTDVDYTADGLGQQTGYAYDAVGNRLTVTTPKTETTTTAYDALNHATTVTAPSPISTVTKTIYNNFGQATSVIANRVDDTPSGATGLDDVVTTQADDAFGNLTSSIADDGSFTGAIKAKTATTYDQTGAAVTTTAYADTAWTGARTTTNHFETYATGGVTYTRLAASGVVLPIAPAAAPAPLCPEAGSSTRCNTVSALDLNGQATAMTDPYGVVSLADVDLAGRSVQSTTNYVAGGGHGTDNDANIVSSTTYTVLGDVAKTVDPSLRSVVTVYDAVGRPTLVTRYDSAGGALTDTKTVYLPSGRTDRTSTDAAGTADTARAWTKTVYDAAGRAIKTLAHYDIAGVAQIGTDNFEDGVTTSGQVWTNGTAGVHVAAGGSSAAELGITSPNTGEGRLKVITGTGSNTGSEWALAGTFKSGRTYKARAYVNAPSGTTVTLKLGTATDNSGTSVTVAGNGAWQAPASLVSWTPSADRTGVAFAAFRTGSGTAATYYVDDVIVWDAATPDGNVPTETVYDADGQVVRSIITPGDPATEASLVTKTSYDQLGRVIDVTVNHIAGGSTSDAVSNLKASTTYDALGRADTRTDPKGAITKSAFDRLARPISVWLNYVDGTPTDGTSVDDDAKSMFAYDALGEQIGYCPAAQVLIGGCDPADPAEPQAWRYVYDALGRQTKQIPPVNTTAVALNTSETVYELGGRVDKTCTYPAGGSCASTTNTRWTDLVSDALGRTKTTQVYDRSTGSDVLNFTFTTTYNVDSTPTSMSDGTDTLTYVGDSAGRLDQLKRGSTVLTDYGYNNDGTLGSRVDGTLATTSFQYDWAKRPSTVTLSSSIYSGSPVTFAYRLDGLLKSKALPGGTETATLAYDAAKRPTALNFTIAGTGAIGQTYDRAGNVATESRNLANAAAINGDAKTGTLTYDYDGLNRLTGSTGAGGTRSYRYDLDGNRVYKSDPTRTVTYVFDRTDQLVSETNGTMTNAVYDAFGNQTKKPEDDLTQTTLAYDAANRLTTITPSMGSAATFTFDALSRNKTRVVGGTTTDTYGYLGTTETVYEVATTGGTTRTIDAAFGPDGSRLALKDATGFGWTLFDLHGDFIGLENQAMSAVTDALRYDGYGMTIDSDGVFGSPWKYQGALDVAPNANPLYDLGARNYAPSLGAFTSLDSVLGNAANPLSMNRFLYAESNPTTFIDPDGHATLYCNTETSDTCHPTQSRTGRKMKSTIHRQARLQEQFHWTKSQRARGRARNADLRVVHLKGWAAIRELRSRGPLGNNLLSHDTPLWEEEKDLLQEIARFAAANPDDAQIAFSAINAAPLAIYGKANQEGVSGMGPFFMIAVAGVASLGYKDAPGVGGGKSVTATNSGATEPSWIRSAQPTGVSNVQSSKPGPKPWPEGPHNQTIDRRIKELQDQGYEHLGGGTKSEWVIDTPGGTKSSRRPDITMRAPDGTIYHENVGRTYAGGSPYAREVSALDDLEGPLGFRPTFTPYDR